MNIALWILFGLIIGWLAAIFTNTNGTTKGRISIGVGVAGALVGGLFATAVCQESIANFNIYSLLSAAFGAIIVLWLSELESKSKMRG